MFVAVDTIGLMFTHVHHDHETVSGLSFLEACDRSISVDSTDRPYFLSLLDAFEMRTLYRNTTGDDITGTDPLVVKEMLATIVNEKLKPQLAIPTEVLVQCAYAHDDNHNGIPWRYAIGRKQPTKLGEDGIGTLHCKPLTPTEASEAAARAPQRRKVLPPVTAPAASKAAPQQSTAKHARSFSVKPVIWEHADKAWQAAGAPTDKDVVLKLRKEMMIQLEIQGIKKTSSSNELGNWMKARLAN